MTDFANACVAEIAIADHVPLFRLECCTVVRATNKATICIQTAAHTCGGRQQKNKKTEIE